MPERLVIANTTPLYYLHLARRVAALSHLTYTGTLGVVMKAKQAGHLQAIRPVIERLRASGLWLHDELVAMALAQTGE